MVAAKQIVAGLDVPGLKLGSDTVNKVVVWANAIEQALEARFYVDSLEIDVSQSVLGVKLTIKNQNGQMAGAPRPKSFNGNP